MKPKSSTGSLVELVGAPWEIHRLAIPLSPTSNSSRISDLYTKAGGNIDYTCILALSPDHGIGFSLLVAGSTASAARWPIRDATGELFIPAAEAASAANAQANLAGTFAVPDQPGTNLTLTVDADEGLPGLGLRSLYINGTESRALLLGAKEVSGDEHIPQALRLYPTGNFADSTSLASLYKPTPPGGRKKELSHRLVVTAAPFVPRAGSEGREGELFDGQPYWMTLDFEDSMDEFVLVLGEGERVVGVRSVGLGLGFERV